MTDMEKQLNQYYERVRIAPVSWSRDLDEMFSAFQCKKKVDCREACRKAYQKASPQKEGFRFEPRVEEVEGFDISPYYQARQYKGNHIPRIVVVSQSAPHPWEERDNKPAENSKTPLNLHWRETLAMVRSFLHPFIASENFPEPARYWEDESRKKIEKLFVHVRTAKCCSNANEPGKVYANCGGYLGEELSILKPDVIVTQGNKARDMAKQHAFNAIEQVKGLDLERPIAHIVNLKEGNQRVYWLRLYLPNFFKGFFFQAGDKIDSESHVVGAKREHFVRYGEAIKEFINDR